MVVLLIPDRQDRQRQTTRTRGKMGTRKVGRLEFRVILQIDSGLSHLPVGSPLECGVNAGSLQLSNKENWRPFLGGRHGGQGELKDSQGCTRPIPDSQSSTDPRDNMEGSEQITNNPVNQGSVSSHPQWNRRLASAHCSQGQVTPQLRVILTQTLKDSRECYLLLNGLQTPHPNRVMQCRSSYFLQEMGHKRRKKRKKTLRNRGDLYAPVGHCSGPLN